MMRKVYNQKLGMKKSDKILIEEIMNGQFSQEESLGHLKNLFKDYQHNKALINYYGFYLVNAGFYKDGINILKLNKTPKSETRVLAEYIALTNLGKLSEAIETVFNFLKHNKAVLLKDTLIELQEGLQNGYHTDFSNEIIYYSKLNNVLVG